MSERAFKRYRRELRAEYRDRVCFWLDHEPPRWRIFAHMRWKRKKPIPPKCFKSYYG